LPKVLSPGASEALERQNGCHRGCSHGARAVHPGRYAPHLYVCLIYTNFRSPVANLPAEIAHLYEEANAKQEMINECNSIIASRDGQLQKWVKVSGSLTAHPKEEAFSKAILEAYGRAQVLQAEKIALVQKAVSLVG
jgi:hypothetical protein